MVCKTIPSKNNSIHASPQTGGRDHCVDESGPALWCSSAQRPESIIVKTTLECQSKGTNCRELLLLPGGRKRVLLHPSNSQNIWSVRVGATNPHDKSTDVILLLDKQPRASPNWQDGNLLFWDCEVELQLQIGNSCLPHNPWVFLNNNLRLKDVTKWTVSLPLSLWRSAWSRCGLCCLGRWQCLALAPSPAQNRWLEEKHAHLREPDIVGKGSSIYGLSFSSFYSHIEYIISRKEQEQYCKAINHSTNNQHN